MRDTLTAMIIEAEEQGTINSSHIGSWTCFGTHEQNRASINKKLDEIEKHLIISQWQQKI
jgi:hypothetical protein